MHLDSIKIDFFSLFSFLVYKRTENVSYTQILPLHITTYYSKTGKVLAIGQLLRNAHCLYIYLEFARKIVLNLQVPSRSYLRCAVINSYRCFTILLYMEG